MKRLLNTLYVTNPEAYLKKKDDAISVRVDHAEVMSVPFHLLDGVVVFGHVGCSTSLLGACAERGVSVVLLDERGRFKARVEGPVSGNVLLRREQYRRAANEETCLAVAKRFVVAKVHNARIVLQHQVRDYPELKDTIVGSAIKSLASGSEMARSVADLNELRGVEGDAAHVYYGAFAKLLRSTDRGIAFSARSRRPPADPVNAALSFFYTLMARDVATGCEAVGLDPQMGFLHACRPGRSSLALDLVEEFRAPYVDRFVLALFNRRQLSSKDFVKVGSGCVFKERSLKNTIALWQDKKQEQITHPYLGERVKLGLLPFIQAQLLARYLRGDLDDYPACLWR